MDAGDRVLGYVCDDASDPSYYFSVSWYGLNASDVRMIDAGVAWLGAGSPESSFDDLLGYVATVPYEAATPSQARAWVRETATGTKNFGSAVFELTTSSNGRHRQLTIKGR
jgi:hypothetical protein